MSELIGKAIGQYQIIEQIGAGGMATIFKAFQPSIDRYVAIKILPSQLAEDENFVKRFAHEAKAIAALEHPHILPVHDFGTEDNLNYMVMRYVKGGTLSNIMGKPLPHERVVQLVSNVARALDYAHRQGVIHRDIKPSNILIDEHGEVLLTDFGIAKIVEGSKSTQLTAAGSILGTPAYMSPEQAQGQKIDGRSDLYSLGVVLYELLTGRPPYEAETPFAIVLKHINDPLPPPRSVNPDIPEPLERVVLKAMAKDPNQRFMSAGRMERALQNALKEIEGMVVVPGPSTTSVNMMEDTRLQPVEQKPAASKSISPFLIGGVAVMVLLCLLGIGGVVVFGLLTSSGDEDVAAVAIPADNDDDDDDDDGGTGEVMEEIPTPTSTPVVNNDDDVTDPDLDEPAEGILFEDDFGSDQNIWYIGEDEDDFGYFEAQISDGLYRMYMNAAQEDGNFRLIEPPDVNVDDFVLVVDVDYIEHSDEFLYGITFRSDLEDNYYLFELDSDGFVVSLSTPDDWVDLVEYTESPAINPEGPNQLMVEAIGPSLSFFINGQEVVTIEDDTLERGAIGLVVELFDQDAEMYIEVDHVTIFEIGEGFVVEDDSGTRQEESLFEEDDPIIFAEEFDSDDNGWFTGEFEDEYGYQGAEIADGLYRYYIDATTEDGNFGLAEPSGLEFRDFVLSVDVLSVEQSGDSLYGIVFRSDSEGNFYILIIEQNAFEVWLARADDDWEVLVDYTETAALDPEGFNHLMIEALGPSVSFFINGEEVAQMEDDTIESGSIGLVLEAFDEESEILVELDNFIVIEAGME